MNSLFQNALQRKTQSTPPIWFMRQAGRYHKHYQGLRSKHSFDQLCRTPELAAQVALGPIQDFDFDVSILFSDLLYPLDALGFDLTYSDNGPHLAKSLASGFFPKDVDVNEAVEQVRFQADALRLTRELLPKNKSLIGFVGGPWTLFVYASEGGHAGNLIFPKTATQTRHAFMLLIRKFLEKNIELQLKAGAEVVMVFDTAAGEVGPQFFKSEIADHLISLAQMFPGKLGYYSKGTQSSFFDSQFLSAPWAGRGIDHRWNLKRELESNNQGFLQGNFDQALLFLEKSDFEKALKQYFMELQSLPAEGRAGWVCGLGHGVLPKTPEQNVKRFVEAVREVFR